MSPALGFFLFVVCTGVLFVRPTDLIESLSDARLYELSIIGCFAASAPLVRRQLAKEALLKNPITMCVVGLLAAVALSHLSHFAIADAAASTFNFFKPVLSFLLMVGVVNTAARLQKFLVWLFVFILTVAVLALLQHHEIIDNPALAAVRENIYDKATGSIIGFDMRLCAAGIFANPNDLARILVVGIGLSLYFFDGGRPGMFKPFWLGSAGVFFYALTLTLSRGGLIGLFVTLLVISYFRVGARLTALAAVLALPALALVGGSRQTDLSTSEGTGQQRVQLWSDGFVAMKSSPLFGIGLGKYPELTNGLGAHNSFVEAYVEVGFFGGTLFLGAVVCALAMGFSVCRTRSQLAHPILERTGPYLLAILAGYSAGMLSSSRYYMIPTYLLLALVVIHLRLATANAWLPKFRVTPRFALRFVAFSAFAVVALQLFIVTSVRFSSGD